MHSGIAVMLKCGRSGCLQLPYACAGYAMRHAVPREYHRRQAGAWAAAWGT